MAPTPPPDAAVAVAARTATPPEAPAAPAAGRLGELGLVVRLEVADSLRARWLAIYAIVLGGLVFTLFGFSLTESRILGFMGLSRLLVTYIQVCMAIVPIFVLVTTVRSVAGDRESGVLEYLLALPVGLGTWYGGRLLARFALILAPVLGAMALACGWAVLQEIPVPWGLFSAYAGLLVALCACFLGLALLLSSLARSVDVAQASAFLLWLVLVLFLDLVLLGVLIEEHVAPNTVVAIALANPLQVFRTAAMMLFDPQLVLLGPSAYVILDAFGRSGYLAWALAYPTLLGAVAALVGYLRFKRGDLV